MKAQSSSIREVAGYLARGVHLKLSVLAVTLAVLSIFPTGCSRQEVDMRLLVPGDTKAYFYSNDLGRLLRSITESSSFQKIANTSPDVSMLNGVQVMIAVENLKASAESSGSQNATLNLKPSFVLVAETHGWNFQARALVTSVLDRFMKKQYGAEGGFENFSRKDDEWFIWKSDDDRQSIAVVNGSRIYFSNDREALGRVLAVRETPEKSLAATSTFSLDGDELAVGRLSKAGVDELAEFAALSVAGEGDSSAGVISSIVPKLIRNGIKSVEWRSSLEKSAAATRDDVVRDSITIKIDKDEAKVLSSSMKPRAASSRRLAEFTPDGIYSVTRYRLERPRIAFRSGVLLAAKNLEGVQRQLVGAASVNLLNPYGVSDAEAFLQNVGSDILTIRLDEDGEETAAIFEPTDFDEISKHLLFDFSKAAAEKIGGNDCRKNDENKLILCRISKVIVVGGEKAVGAAVKAYRKFQISPKSPSGGIIDMFDREDGSALTLTRGEGNAAQLVELFTANKPGERVPQTYSLTTTRFASAGIERDYLSDFGFVGLLIAEFAEN